MMMHHDSQPLVSWKTTTALSISSARFAKRERFTRRCSCSSPSPGSKWYGDTFSSGLAFESVGDRKIEQWIADGNYVVASKHPRPWLKQLSILLAYAYFFNPLRLLLVARLVEVVHRRMPMTKRGRSRKLPSIRAGESSSAGSI